MENKCCPSREQASEKRGRTVVAARDKTGSYRDICACINLSDKMFNKSRVVCVIRIHQHHYIII